MQLLVLIVLLAVGVWADKEKDPSLQEILEQCRNSTVSQMQTRSSNQSANLSYGEVYTEKLQLCILTKLEFLDASGQFDVDKVYMYISKHYGQEAADYIKKGTYTKSLLGSLIVSLFGKGLMTLINLPLPVDPFFDAVGFA